MTRLFRTTLAMVALACIPFTLAAGGLAPPVEITPPPELAEPSLDIDISVHGGLSYSNPTVTETIVDVFTVEECSVPEKDGPLKRSYHPVCEDVEYSETSTVEFEDDVFGGFIGARAVVADVFVVGGELNFTEDLTTAGIQAGLTYADVIFYGYQDYDLDDTDNTFSGVGLDYYFDNGLLLGARGNEDVVEFRVGFNF